MSLVEWVDPRTWVTGQKVRAAQLNEIRDALLYLHGAPRVTLVRDTDLAVPHNSATPVPFTDATVDVGDWWDAGSPEVAVVPETALYVVHFRGVWGPEDGGRRQVRFLRDDAPFGGDQRAGVIHTEQVLTVVSALEEGRALSVDVRQTSGDPINLEARTGPARSAVLIVCRLSDFIV